jgi:7-cyano-7-deazaguanine synthase in queuosine biosynthesis
MKELIVINSSGGLDSTVLTYRALKTTNADILLLNYTYGQNHIVEVHVQKKLYKNLKKEFGDRILGNINVDLSTVYKAGKKIFNDLKTIRENKEIEEVSSHEFYTPSRNLLFMAAASALGELAAIVKNYDKLYLGIGVHKHSDIAYGSENTQYWDITPEFILTLQNVLNLNDIIDIEIYAPYKEKFKSSIIEDMKKFKVKYKKTWTCYNPVEESIMINSQTPAVTFTPCNKCEACIERALQAKDIITKDINDYTIVIKNPKV